MKDFIRKKLNQHLFENKKVEYEYQHRDIGGSDVYYKRKKVMNNIEKIIHIENIRDIQKFQEISEFIQITYLTDFSNTSTFEVESE